MTNINASSMSSYKDIKRIQNSELHDAAKLGVQRALAAREKVFEQIRNQSSEEFVFRMRVAAMFNSVSDGFQGRDRIKYLTDAIDWLASALEIAPSVQSAAEITELLTTLRASCSKLFENVTHVEGKNHTSSNMTWRVTIEQPCFSTFAE